MPALEPIKYEPRRAALDRRCCPFGFHGFRNGGFRPADLSILVWLLMLICLAAPTGFTTAECRAAAPVREEPPLRLRMGANSDFSPYEFTNAKGVADGFSVDLIRAIAREMNFEIDLMLGSWQEMRRMLADRRIDALTGMLYSKERDVLFDFSVPHLIVSYAIFVRKGTEFNSVENLKNKEVLVVADVYAHDWLLANAFTPFIFTVERPQDALEQLSAGMHDFAVLPRLHGLDLLRNRAIENVETVGPPVLTQKFCFAVAAGNADLLAKLNEGLVMVQRDGEYDRIYRKWFSVYEHNLQYLKYARRIGIPLLLLLAAVLLWNFFLKKTVTLKTRKLRQNEALLAQIIQSAPMATFVIDRDHRVIHWNKACQDLTGVSDRQIIGTPDHRSAFYHNERPAISDLLLDLGDAEEVCSKSDMKVRLSSVIEGACETELVFSRSEHDGKWLSGTAVLLRDVGGQVIGAIESWKDLTEHKQLEAQLIQSQKMEAIGTLAGGIAHDFGNIMTAIMGIAEMGRRNAARGNPAADFFNDIMKASGHANNLVRRILTFSRQSELQANPLRIDTLVEEAVDLIRATTPSSIHIDRLIDCQEWVSVEATQIQQVLMNLCANAIHAMQGENGTLTIRIATATGDEIHALGSEIEAQRRSFVKLSVSDSGHGIPKQIVDRIFDPFFTTKERGEGTGMGLSISHAIVKRFGGAIAVDSRQGEGTTFKIFLPVIDKPASAPVSAMSKGGEHVLMVHGDTISHDVNPEILRQQGYKVTMEPLAQSALDKLQSRSVSPDLIITTIDIENPPPGAFIRMIRAICPQTPIIMAMGFSTDLDRINAEQLGADAIIKRPILMHELASLIRELLDRRPTSQDAELH